MKQIDEELDIFCVELEAFLGAATEQDTARETIVEMLTRSLAMLFALNVERTRLRDALRECEKARNEI